MLPGYAAIGRAAPLLILAGRLVQGLSAGVELGGVAVYFSEIAPPNRRGFFVSWQHDGLRLAHSVYRRLRDRAVHLLAAPLVDRDRGLRSAQRASGLEADARDDARDDDADVGTTVLHLTRLFCAPSNTEISRQYAQPHDRDILRIEAS